MSDDGGTVLKEAAKAEASKAPRAARAPRVARAAEGELRSKRRDNEGIELRNWYDEDKLDFKNYVYRYARGTGQRMHRLTKMDDYEPVTDDGTEAFREHHGGTEGDSITRMVLLKKPKHFYDMHQSKRLERIRMQEQETIDGKPLLDAEDGGLDAKHAYKPNTQNVIGGAFKP